MTTVPAGDRQWGGRLPLLGPDDLDDDQRSLDADLRSWSVPWAEQSGFAASTDDGRLIGPWNVYLSRPVPGRGYNAWLKTDTSGSTLPATAREVVILTVRAAWGAEYEIYSHVVVARRAGLPESVIDAVREHRTTDDFTPEQLVAHAFTDELVRSHAISDDTYRRAESTFGRDGVLDLVHLISMYLALSAQLNAFAVPAPPIPSAPDT